MAIHLARYSSNCCSDLPKMSEAPKGTTLKCQIKVAAHKLDAERSIDRISSLDSVEMKPESAAVIVKAREKNSPWTNLDRKKWKTLWISFVSKIARWVTYSHLHLLYFCILACVGSLVLWSTPKPKLKNLRFIDALFTAVSVLSLTGLSCVSIQDWSTGGDACILLLTILDSIFLASLFPVYLKLLFFRYQQKVVGLESSKARKIMSVEVPSVSADLESLGNVRQKDQQNDSVDMEARLSIHDNNGDLPSNCSANDKRLEAQDDSFQLKSPLPNMELILKESVSQLADQKHNGLLSDDRQNSIESWPTQHQSNLPGRKINTLHLENPPPQDVPNQLAARSDASKVEYSQNASVLSFEVCPGSENLQQVEQSQNSASSTHALLGYIHRLVRCCHIADFNCFKEFCSNLLQKLVSRSSSTKNSSTFDLGKYSSLHEMEEEIKVSGDADLLKILEHEALHALSQVVLRFSTVTLLMGFVFMEIYLLCSPNYREALRERKVNHVFFSFSTSVGAFSNSGIFFLNDNFMAFRRSAPILLCVSLQSVVGNTLFAPAIRATIWLLYHRTSTAREKLRYEYLLRYPRKCYTQLFPSKQTIWLVVTVISFTALQDLLFLLLNWNSKALEGLAAADKLLDSFFQSVTTRNAGANVVNLADVSVAMLVIYTGMMYIAIYPVYLSRQSSLERRDIKEPHIRNSDPRRYYWKRYSEEESSKISVQLKKLLARDSAYLFIAISVICVLESSNINHDPLNYSVFNIFFEVISAYGNIGLSIGYNCKLRLQHYPSHECEDVSYSFSGKWSASGKLVLMVVMILGRHRVLPDEADEATRLPWKDFLMSKSHHNDTVSKIPDPIESNPGNNVGYACRSRELLPSVATASSSNE